jgi:hypothetical protein
MPNLKSTPDVEIWKSIAGYEDYYEVSNLGRVRSMRSGRGTFMGRILKTPPDTDGYPRVRLSKCNRVLDVNVHVLVAVTFLGPVPNGYEVDHKDDIRGNARLDNLQYLTHAQNSQKAARRKTCQTQTEAHV